jgi:hypothetical protein
MSVTPDDGYSLSIIGKDYTLCQLPVIPHPSEPDTFILNQESSLTELNDFFQIYSNYYQTLNLNDSKFLRHLSKSPIPYKKSGIALIILTTEDSETQLDCEPLQATAYSKYLRLEKLTEIQKLIDFIQRYKTYEPLEDINESIGILRESSTNLTTDRHLGFLTDRSVEIPEMDLAMPEFGMRRANTDRDRRGPQKDQASPPPIENKDKVLEIYFDTPMPSTAKPEFDSRNSENEKNQNWRINEKNQNWRINEKNQNWRINEKIEETISRADKTIYRDELATIQEELCKYCVQGHDKKFRRRAAKQSRQAVIDQIEKMIKKIPS